MLYALIVFVAVVTGTGQAKEPANATLTSLDPPHQLECGWVYKWRARVRLAGRDKEVAESGSFVVKKRDDGQARHQIRLECKRRAEELGERFVSVRITKFDARYTVTAIN